MARTIKYYTVICLNLFANGERRAISYAEERDAKRFKDACTTFDLGAGRWTVQPSQDHPDPSCTRWETLKLEDRVASVSIHCSKIIVPTKKLLREKA